MCYILKNKKTKVTPFIKLACSKANLIAATGLIISNWIQIVDFSACMTLKFDGWPQKRIGHVFYTMSSFVNHFKSIGEVQLELQSGNAQFGSKLVIFGPAWPWNLIDDLEQTIAHPFCTTLSYAHHFKAMGEFNLELQTGNARFGSKSAIFCPVWP